VSRRESTDRLGAGTAGGERFPAGETVKDLDTVLDGVACGIRLGGGAMSKLGLAVTVGDLRTLSTGERAGIRAGLIRPDTFIMLRRGGRFGRSSSSISGLLAWGLGIRSGSVKARWFIRFA